jgi:hypothetical protein
MVTDIVDTHFRQARCHAWPRRSFLWCEHNSPAIPERAVRRHTGGNHRHAAPSLNACFRVISGTVIEVEREELVSVSLVELSARRDGLSSRTSDSYSK